MKLAICVPTRKEFDRLMVLLHGQGLQAGNGDPRNWAVFREDYKMTVSIEGDTIGYSFEQWYWNNNYTVISLAEYEKMLKTKPSIGDTVTIVSAQNGAKGADGKTGIVTDKQHTNGFYSRLRVQTDSGVWGIGDKAIVKIVKRGKKVGRRTFRLKKATEWLKKGAIFQEACDDGDQEYTLLDSDFIRFDDANEYNLGDCSRSRKAVEENPQWFEEVFPATATWLSETELKKFKEFLKA